MVKDVQHLEFQIVFLISFLYGLLLFSDPNDYTNGIDIKLLFELQ